MHPSTRFHIFLLTLPWPFSPNPSPSFGRSANPVTAVSRTAASLSRGARRIESGSPYSERPTQGRVGRGYRRWYHGRRHRHRVFVRRVQGDPRGCQAGESCFGSVSNRGCSRTFVMLFVLLLGIATTAKGFWQRIRATCTWGRHGTRIQCPPCCYVARCVKCCLSLVQ